MDLYDIIASKENNEEIPKQFPLPERLDLMPATPE